MKVELYINLTSIKYTTTIQFAMLLLDNIMIYNISASKDQISSTLPSDEPETGVQVGLNPPILCTNDSNCKHIVGAECDETQSHCVCKKQFSVTDGKRCYRGK